MRRTIAAGTPPLGEADHQPVVSRGAASGKEGGRGAVIVRPPRKCVEQHLSPVI